MTPFASREVAAAYDRWTPEQRSALLSVRALIYDEAMAGGVGEIGETLKWGEPSYVPVAARTGTPVRLSVTKQGAPAVFAHCQTQVVPAFREAFGDAFRYDGNRAVLIGPDTEALRRMIRHALTYHLKVSG